MFDERKDGNPTAPEMSQKEKPMEKQANDGIRNSFSNGDKFLNSRFVGKEESFKKTKGLSELQLTLSTFHLPIDNW